MTPRPTLRPALMGWAACVLPAFVLGCVSSTDVEGLQSQLADTQRQVLQLQKQSPTKEEALQLQNALTTQFQALLKSQADSQVRLDNLANQVSQLEARVEDTNYRLTQLLQQMAANNQDLRSARASGGSGEVGAGGPATAAPPPDPQALYQAAYADYLRRNFEQAIAEFRQYVAAFPDTDLSDNAAYWIGECYFSQGRYPQAIHEFDEVLTRYPRSDKIASAWLKKGFAYLESGERQQGIVQLQHLVHEYPRSDEASLATQRLRSLGVDAGK